MALINNNNNNNEHVVLSIYVFLSVAPHEPFSLKTRLLVLPHVYPSTTRLCSPLSLKGLTQTS